MFTFDQFDTDWRNRHKSRVPKEEDFTEPSPYPWWARGASFIAFLTSALMSGVHTMTMVYNSIALSAVVTEEMRRGVAYGSFISYELGMFMAAFLMTVDNTRTLARRLAFTIFATLIAVNFYSVLNVYGFRDMVAAAVSITFAFVPMVAYASGKFYINIGIAERALARKSKEAFLAAKQVLEAEINRDYDEYVAAYQAREREEAQRLLTEQKAEAARIRREERREKRKNDELHEPFMKPPVKGQPRVKLHEVAREVHENGDVNMTSTEMMAKYGISLGGTSKVREILKGYTNGKTVD